MESFGHVEGVTPSECPNGLLGTSMRFVLIDRILEVEPNRCRLSGNQILNGQMPRLIGVKNLSLAEEYLGDHFPGFPVMPGVLMLEALTQAGACWSASWRILRTALSF